MRISNICFVTPFHSLELHCLCNIFNYGSHRPSYNLHSRRSLHGSWVEARLKLWKNWIWFSSMWTVNETRQWSSYLRPQSEMFDVEIYKCKHTIRVPVALVHWEHNQYLLDISMNQSYPITRDQRYSTLSLSIYSTCTTYFEVFDKVHTWDRLSPKNPKEDEEKSEI